MPFCQDVRQLFGGFQNARRTLRVRRYSGLFPMRMRRQHRFALDPGDQVGWPREGRSFYRQFREDRPADESPAIPAGAAYAVESVRRSSGLERRQVNSYPTLKRTSRTGFSLSGLRVRSAERKATGLSLSYWDVIAAGARIR